MQTQPFFLDVVTLKKVVFSEPIESVIAPGTVGHFGILAGHTPFVSSLQTGITKITKANGEKFNLSTSGGFLMTDGKKVILLAESAERPEEIDVNRAQRAKERAEKRLAEKNPDTDIDRARTALLRAINRLKLSGGQ
ncbi:MAG: ATP synthase F1 subunit epsilon [Deltaproteobacteria bacterium RBG_16_49_23]|nr:MAG: ATP synthase F1 subunit epsilon [Deltaproteobacteria bacterium RBG_16_49_23]